MPDRKVDYLLIGGGLASANCARWLREEGAEGVVVLVAPQSIASSVRRTGSSSTRCSRRWSWTGLTRTK
jgi:glycine/D-amino acid oxidase-like deaminating enzyme